MVGVGSGGRLVVEERERSSFPEIDVLSIKEMRALVGGLYQEDLGGISQATEEKTGVHMLPRGS